ncbi:MAG TPA: NADH-quinone oxidoreductase subunit NuoE [Gemmatimonadota bacterium]
MEFTAGNRARFDELVVRYPSRRAAMLPTLWLVQRQEGWISAEAMEYVAGLLGVSPVEVQEVVSFYTMYDRKPPGRYKLQVCRTLSCALMGAYDVIRQLEERLGIHDGETTADGLFTLQEVECLGSCGTAPMMQVNDTFVENLTRERVDELLERLRREQPELGLEPVIHELAAAQAAIPKRVVSSRGDGRAHGRRDGRSPGHSSVRRGDDPAGRGGR